MRSQRGHSRCNQDLGKVPDLGFPRVKSFILSKAAFLVVEPGIALERFDFFLVDPGILFEIPRSLVSLLLFEDPRGSSSSSFGFCERTLVPRFCCSVGFARDIPDNKDSTCFLLDGVSLAMELPRELLLEKVSASWFALL